MPYCLISILILSFTDIQQEKWPELCHMHMVIRLRFFFYTFHEEILGSACLSFTELCDFFFTPLLNLSISGLFSMTCFIIIGEAGMVENHDLDPLLTLDYRSRRDFGKLNLNI